MPVDTEHPKHIAFSDRWARCRTFMQGEDAVHAAGTSYLPQLEGQTGDEYNAYVGRAMVFGASGRTRKGLLGAVFYHPPVMNGPTDDFFENISSRNEGAKEHARWTFRELLTTGRVGLLLDHPSGVNAANAAPFVAAYNAEDIWNWKTVLLDGKTELEFVVLRETAYEVSGKDDFEVVPYTCYRELRLDRTGDVLGNYYQQKWSQERNSDGRRNGPFTRDGDQVYPDVRGVKVDRIPFRFIGVENIDIEPDQPPLLDVVNVNASHYRNSADMEHGLHFTGLPTAWVAGFPADAKLRIGSATAWVSQKTDANAKYLEFTGQGLGALKSAMAEKVELMAVLGARMIESQKKGVEATETLQLRNKGEHSVLSTIAQNVSRAYTEILELRRDWMGLSGDVSFALNTDLAVYSATPQMLAEWRNYVAAGLLSYESLYQNMKRAEMVAEDGTAETELDKIEIDGGNQGVAGEVLQ